MNYDSVHDISSRLSRQLSLGSHSNIEIVLEVLKDLMRSSQGQVIESRKILGSVMKLTHVKDSRVKKLVYLYLSFVADEDSDVWLHVMNSVSNDLASPNPLVRESALSFLTDSRSVSSALNDARVDRVAEMLKDPNPFVRKCAVAGVAKLVALFNTRTVQFDMAHVLEEVKRMIYSDDDPAVIVECIHCLRSCKKQSVEAGLLLSLVERLDMVEPWTKAEIVNLFAQVCDPYKVTHEEVFQALNLIDPYLDSKYDTSLSLTCATAMLSVSKPFSNILVDVKARVLEHLLFQIAILPDHTKPLHFSSLDIVTDKSSLSKLVPHYKRFLPLPFDDPFLKVQKLKLLMKVCTQENATQLFKTVTSVMITAKEDELVFCAADALLSVHDYLPSRCEDFFRSLMQHDSVAVVSAAVEKLWHVVFVKNTENSFEAESLVNDMVQIYEKLSSFETKSAIFSFASVFANKAHADKLSHILTSELDAWPSSSSVLFKLCLVRAAVSFYFLSPTTFQSILGRALCTASQGDNLLVRRQALMYHNLLQHDVEAARVFVSDVNKLKHCSDAKCSQSEESERLKSLDLLCFRPG